MSDICPLISLKWPWFRFPKGQSGTSIVLTLKIRMSEKNAPWVPRGPWGHPQILSFFDSFFFKILFVKNTTTLWLRRRMWCRVTTSSLCGRHCFPAQCKCAEIPPGFLGGLISFLRQLCTQSREEGKRPRALRNRL